MKEKLNWFHVAVIVYMIEVDVDIFRGDRIANENLGTNNWLGILILGLFSLFNLVLISLVVRYGKGRSVFDIMEASIAKPLLYPIYALLVALWISYASFSSKDYLLMYQFFSFPSRSLMVLFLLFTVLVYYLLIQSPYNISKAITGFFFIVFWLPFIFIYFLQDWSMLRLTPFFFQGASENSLPTLGLWAEVYEIFVGYELALLLIPYCDKGCKWIKGLFIGQLWVCCVYVFTTIIIGGFFSSGQLKRITYPIINMFSYLDLPFINRVENITFTFFVFNILSHSAMYCLAALLTLRRMFPAISVKWLAASVACAFYALAWLPQLIRQAEQLHQFLDYIEMSLAFMAPLALLLLLGIQRLRKRGAY